MTRLLLDGIAFVVVLYLAVVGLLIVFGGMQ